VAQREGEVRSTLAIGDWEGLQHSGGDRCIIPEIGELAVINLGSIYQRWESGEVANPHLRRPLRNRLNSRRK